MAANLYRALMHLPSAPMLGRTRTCFDNAFPVMLEEAVYQCSSRWRMGRCWPTAPAAAAARCWRVWERSLARVSKDGRTLSYAETHILSLTRCSSSS